MKVLRLVATEEGESRFTEFDIPLVAKKGLAGVPLRVSNGFYSPNISFHELPAPEDPGWHGAKARRIGIILSGVLEFEIGNGEKRQLCAGEVFLADDVEGRHATRVVEGPVRLVFIPFPSDFDIEQWSA